MDEEDLHSVVLCASLMWHHGTFWLLCYNRYGEPKQKTINE